MSRSNRGKKNPTHDYWGKRALSGDCGFGPGVKKLTHQIERAQAKQRLLDEPKTPEYDEQEHVPEEKEES